MKSIEDIRLEAKVSDMILGLAEEARDGKLEDVDDGDLAGICEALAVNIINTVKG